MQGLGERVADIAWRSLLESQDEVTHGRMRKTGADQSEEERDRQRDQPRDLPPEDVVCDETRRSGGEAATTLL